MKPLTAHSIPIAALLLLTDESLGQEVRIKDETIAFLYEARAEIWTPDHKLAEILSVDYRNARDEFTRHDLMQ